MKTNRIITAAVLGGLLLAAGPAAAQNVHSATATGGLDDLDGRAYGYALGYPTLKQAIQQAKSRCERQGKGICIILQSFAGPGCAAVVRSEDHTVGGIGVGWIGVQQSHLDEAINNATIRCEFSDGTNCRAIERQCITNADISNGNYPSIAKGGF